MYSRAYLCLLIKPPSSAIHPTIFIVLAPIRVPPSLVHLVGLTPINVPWLIVPVLVLITVLVIVHLVKACITSSGVVIVAVDTGLLSGIAVPNIIRGRVIRQGIGVERRRVAGSSALVAAKA